MILLAPITRPEESTCQYREHFQYFQDNILNRIQRGCKRIISMSIMFANESITNGGQTQLCLMTDIDVDADLDLRIDEPICEE